ncbi:hypothetical protein QFC20_002868 [Naganishia adeliensis]|uniref:Uncharacterized protein n=1 Tax=Naganishia adeliensis TaxID=92952 RepID=A0ACC2WGS5_9TREE|nr:hypothetical protein QFC20_002868 [Naganishia adeliensis]
MAIPQLRAFGPSIKDHADPTFNLYFPLLAAQVDAGAFLEPTEHRYGPLERHAYDVYLPPGDKDGKGKLKTIVFVHGGGMVQGDKQIPESKGGAHRNIGTFFANRGFLVIIPNYRLRYPNPAHPLYSTPNNAQFPSGGTDIALLLRHISSPACHVSPRISPSQLTIIGNSAGACHVATYLYRDAVPNFEESMAPLVTDPTNQPGKEELTPSGAMLIGMPAHFRLAGPERAPVTYGYHCPELFGKSGVKDEGMRKVVEERCPIGLRKVSGDRTRVGVMLAELDPEPEIAGPSREFSKLHEQVTGMQVQEVYVKGHNHISVPLGLGLGGEEEVWGDQLIEWIEGK